MISKQKRKIGDLESERRQLREMNELFHLENIRLKLNTTRVTSPPQSFQMTREPVHKVSFLRRDLSCDLTRDTGESDPDHLQIISAMAHAIEEQLG